MRTIFPFGAGLLTAPCYRPQVSRPADGDLRSIRVRGRETCAQLAMIVLVACAQAGCQKAPPPPVTEVVMKSAATLPATPDDAAWQAAPEYVAKLQLQDLVEPRLLKPSTAAVRVRALQNGADVALRLEWTDATPNNTPGPAKFSDGCAVQFPAKADPSVPAPQMGEPGKPVEITFWSANWQAIVDGRPDNIKALYPTAQIDHYPAEAVKDAGTRKEMAARYSPARALGNNRSTHGLGELLTLGSRSDRQRKGYTIHTC